MFTTIHALFVYIDMTRRTLRETCFVFQSTHSFKVELFPTPPPLLEIPHNYFNAISI